MKISKIFLCLKIVFNSKFRFKKPEHKPMILFDGMSSDELRHVLKNLKYFILETRFERTKEFFITKKIIFTTIKNLKIGLFDSYLLSVIDEINPKIVFTFIDNSHRFSNFSKLRDNKYHFIALQNGARSEHKIVNLLKKKKIRCELGEFYIPHFMCFGDYEIFDYKKNNQIIGKFDIVGSLKLSNFLISQKNLKKKKNNDVLLISDLYCWDKILENFNFPIEKGLIDLIKFTINFCIKNNLKMKFAARSKFNNFSKENEFYKKYLNEYEYKFLKKNIFYRSKNYKTYKIMQRSKVVIGTMSTMLRENLSLNGKTFACNFTKTDIFDFPIKGICFTKKSNYQDFQKKLKKILSLSMKEYYNKMNRKRDFVCNNKINSFETINLVNKKLKFILNTK